jgi:hypothetical protein
MIYLHSRMANNKAYDATAKLLRQNGYSVKYDITYQAADFKAGDIFISAHAFALPAKNLLRQKKAKLYTGQDWSRSSQLKFASSLNPLNWCAPLSVEAAQAVFDSWNVEQVIFKKSNTGASLGVSLVNTSDVTAEMCNGSDIFNLPLANTPLYKIECLNGEHLISWQREAEGLGAIQVVSSEKVRLAWTPPAELLSSCLALSKNLTEVYKIPHVAFDFLEKDSVPRLIEINMCNIAMWWTQENSTFVDNFSQAMLQMIQENVSA